MISYLPPAYRSEIWIAIDYFLKVTVLYKFVGKAVMCMANNLETEMLC
jgi:hypothetical protein